VKGELIFAAAGERIVFMNTWHRPATLFCLPWPMRLLVLDQSELQDLAR